MLGFQIIDLALFTAGAFAAAYVTGLAGFAFGIVATAMWLHFLPPAQVTPLIAAFALIVQGVAVWKLRQAVKLAPIVPFVIGSALGGTARRRAAAMGVGAADADGDRRRVDRVRALPLVPAQLGRGGQ